MWERVGGWGCEDGNREEVVIRRRMWMIVVFGSSIKGSSINNAMVSSSDSGQSCSCRSYARGQVLSSSRQRSVLFLPQLRAGAGLVLFTDQQSTFKAASTTPWCLRSTAVSHVHAAAKCGGVFCPLHRSAEHLTTGCGSECSVLL
jgi:hypothetical protein